MLKPGLAVFAVTVFCVLSVLPGQSVADDDNYLDIGSLTFSDPGASSDLSIDDGCSDSTLYTSDGSCSITFDFLSGSPTSDLLYSATLEVKEVDSSGDDDDDYNDYSLRFVGETDLDDEAVLSSSYVIGGDDAEREYPWMVALYSGSSDTDYLFTCGGVLISSQWIATAAHCIDESAGDGIEDVVDADSLMVIIGGTTHYSSISAATAAGVASYSLDSLTMHPNYDDDAFDYDIALLELSSAYYEPGPALATSDRFDTLSNGDTINLIGYGVTSNTSSAGPTTLQQAELAYIDYDNCTDYWAASQLTDNMFCAGSADSSDSSGDSSTDTSTDSCSGDSGGPLFIEADGELTLIGLVSWGSTECGYYPGVYTKISELRSWTTNNIDGFQVVEEGTASYDSDSASFDTGMISVYYYGSSSSDDADDDSSSSDDVDDDSSSAAHLGIISILCLGYIGWRRRRFNLRGL